MTELAVYDTSDIGILRSDCVNILWNCYKKNHDEFCISLPVYIEENADFYKSKFLGWLELVSQQKKSGKTLEQYFDVGNELSYFWFTSIGQRNNIVDDSNINTIIKIFAVEDIIRSRQISSISLYSSDRMLHGIFKEYCKDHQYPYKYEILNTTAKRRAILKPLFEFTKSISYLFYFSLLRITRKRRTFDQKKSDLIFFDMFVNINVESFAKNEFLSNYWTTLPGLLKKLSINVTWSHFFYKHSETKNISHANIIIDKLNAFSSNEQHVIIDAGLTFPMLINSFLQYLKLFRKTLFIKRAKIFNVNGFSDFNLERIARNEFHKSCYGVDAIKFFLYLNLIEHFVGGLEYKKLGIYIQENQPWESILLSLWKKHNHGVMIGLPHSTIRYWDLRYFYPEAIFHRKAMLKFPDFIATNGPVAYELLFNSGINKKVLLKVEALRYLHLLGKFNKAPTIPNNGSIHKYRLLICGDFLTDTNKKMFKCIQDSISLWKIQVEIFVKPHPGTPISDSLIKQIKGKVVTGNLSALIDDFNIIFTSNISSSAVDIYLSGGKLIQFQDGSYFNMSPLRGIDNCHYVDSPEALAEYINNSNEVVAMTKDFFFLDKNLNLWNKMILEFLNSPKRVHEQ